MAAEKITRKELLKENDAFMAAAEQSAEWVTKNRRQLMIVLSVLLIAAVGAWAVASYLENRDHRASQLFAEAQKIAQGEIVSGETKADPTAAKPTFVSEEERNKAVQKALQKVIDEAPASGVASLATLRLALITEQLGNRDEAEKMLLRIREQLTGQDPFYFVVIERLAYLQEQRGDLAAALTTLETLSADKNSFYQDYALFHQARLHVLKNDTDKARSLLERLKKDYQTSTVQEEVEELLAQLPTAPDAKSSTANVANHP